VCEHQITQSPTSRRYDSQKDASTGHGFSNNMTVLYSNRATLLALSSSLALTVSLGGIVTLLDNQVLRAVVVAAREV
jgi:hypothetical protein